MDTIEVTRLRERKGEVLRACAKDRISLHETNLIADWVWGADRMLLSLCDEIDRIRTEADVRVADERERVARLEKALEPFAEAAENCLDDPADANMWEHPAAMATTAGDFQRARTAIKRAAP